MTKAKLFGLAILAPALACAASSPEPAAPSVETVETALDQWDMEAARNAIAFIPQGAEKGYLEAVIANRENRLDVSIRLLRASLPVLDRSDPVRAQKAYDVLYDDYLRAQDYRSQYALAQAQLESLGPGATPEALTGLKGDLAMAAALKDMPRTRSTGQGPTTLTTYVNGLGTRNVDLTVNGVKLPWMIDSGANFSIVSETAARRMKLNIVDTANKVVGSTDAQTGFRIAAIRNLPLGSVTLHDVMALVVPDAALKMRRSSGDQQIDAALGLPALAALGQFTIDRSGAMTISPGAKPLVTGAPLYMDQLYPVVESRIASVPLFFIIDTGAALSTFWAPYRDRFRSRAAQWRHEQQGASGMGGDRVADVAVEPSVTITIGDHAVTQTDVAIAAGQRGPSPGIAGNLGQPIFKDAKSYTFDFRSMRLEFDAS